MGRVSLQTSVICAANDSNGCGWVLIYDAAKSQISQISPAATRFDGNTKLTKASQQALRHSSSTRLSSATVRHSALLSVPIPPPVAFPLPESTLNHRKVGTALQPHSGSCPSDSMRFIARWIFPVTRHAPRIYPTRRREIDDASRPSPCSSMKM